jgi:hypothetical protein
MQQALALPGIDLFWCHPLLAQVCAGHMVWRIHKKE